MIGSSDRPVLSVRFRKDNGLMKQLSRQGVPVEDDRELMADRFCLPFP